MATSGCLLASLIFLMGMGAIFLVLHFALKWRFQEMGILGRASRKALVDRKVIQEIVRPDLRAHIRQWVDSNDRVTEVVALLPHGVDWLAVRTPNWNVLTPFGGLDVPWAPSFKVTTSNPVWAMSFLDDRTRFEIESLSTIFNEAVFLDVRPGQFVVRVREPKASLPRIEKLLEFGTRLAARAISLSGDVQAGAVQAGVGRCAVCGKVVRPVRQLVCPLCRTPHHRDCWAYNEGCAKFGCEPVSSSN